MTLVSGLASYVNIAEEPTWGTSVTPSRSVPFLNETLDNAIAVLESESIIAGRQFLRPGQWTQDVRRVSGDLATEVLDRGMGLLWKHAIGAVQTTSLGGGLHEHTFTPGHLTGLGLTMGKAIPKTDGSGLEWLTYVGMKVASWELSVTAEEIATATFSFVGKQEAQSSNGGPPLQVANYPVTLQRPMTHAGGEVLLNSEGACMRSVSISGDNGLTTERVCIGNTFIDEPVQVALRTLTIEAELEFKSMVQYNRFINGEEVPFSIKLVVPGTSASFTISSHVRTDGATPKVAGRDLVVVTTNLVALGATDAAALTAVLVNGDATV